MTLVIPGEIYDIRLDGSFLASLGCRHPLNFDLADKGLSPIQLRP